jgi:trigger factor
MKALVREAGPCRKILEIQATGEEIEPAFEEVIQIFIKGSRLRGFRPGKAPRGLVEKHYAKDILEEVESSLLPRFYRQALKENELSPVGVVNMGEVSLRRNEGLSFQVTVDVPPEFAMPQYDRFVLKEAKIEVTGEQINEAIRSMQDRFSRFEEINEGTVSMENLVQVDYNGRCNEQPVAELAPKHAALGAARDFWMLVAERELLPGMSAGLVGAKVGETRTVKVTFPENCRAPELAGREAEYTVTLKRIRERRLPAMDADFLKQCGAETEEALRERVRNDLWAMAEQNERSRRASEIERMLLEETNFEVPQSVMAEEMDATIRGMIRNIITEGGSREMIEQNRDQIAGEAERISRGRIRLSYIFSRIADQEKIAVEDGEVEERIVRLAAGYNMEPEKLRAELVKRNGLEGVRADLRNEKTMDFLLKQVKINKEE